MCSCQENCLCVICANLCAFKDTDFSVDFIFTHILEGTTDELPTDITANTYESNILNTRIIAPNVLQLYGSRADLDAMNLGGTRYQIRESLPESDSKIKIQGIFTLSKNYI